MNPSRRRQTVTALATSVRFTDKMLHVRLTDGREISVPLE